MPDSISLLYMPLELFDGDSDLSISGNTMTDAQKDNAAEWLGTQTVMRVWTEE